MKIAYILRGIPGSGKSTLAKILAGESGKIHSVDSYFYVDGEYRFDGTKLAEYHMRSLVAFCNSLGEGGYPAVICDNVNSKLEHCRPYIEAARKAGYLVAIVMLPHPRPEIAVARSTHGVPLATIERLLAEWEY